MVPHKTGLVHSLSLQPEELLKAATNLDEAGYFIEDLSVLDTSDGFMIVYHFDHFDNPGRVALRVLVPHINPEVPSLFEIFPGADWHERECHDFFGISFAGRTGLLPLLLPEDADFHPLVKEEKGRKRIADLMEPGEIQESTPDFDALFARTGDKEDDGEA